MRTITEDKLKENLNEVIRGAVQDEEFCTVHTRYGNAVIISENEWNILVAALKMQLDGM